MPDSLSEITHKSYANLMNSQQGNYQLHGAGQGSGGFVFNPLGITEMLNSSEKRSNSCVDSDMYSSFFQKMSVCCSHTGRGRKGKPSECAYCICLCADLKTNQLLGCAVWADPDGGSVNAHEKDQRSKIRW